MIYPQEWTEAWHSPVTAPSPLEYHQPNLTWGKRAISHELTHLVTHQMVLNPYNDIPRWLDEGIAVYNEGPLDYTFQSALNTAVKSNTLISLQTLSCPFSSDTVKSYLSYAESYSAVAYLIDTYGEDKMLELLETFQKGSYL